MLDPDQVALGSLSLPDTYSHGGNVYLTRSANHPAWRTGNRCCEQRELFTCENKGRGTINANVMPIGLFALLVHVLAL